MKGNLASRFPSSEGEYTDLQVCRSGAGWFVGTMFHNKTLGGFIEQGSRESEYFATEKEALIALANVTWHQRENP